MMSAGAETLSLWAAGSSAADIKRVKSVFIVLIFIYMKEVVSSTL
jgi:hypothetical protein